MRSPTPIATENVIRISPYARYVNRFRLFFDRLSPLEYWRLSRATHESPGIQRRWRAYCLSDAKH